MLSSTLPPPPPPPHSGDNYPRHPITSPAAAPANSSSFSWNSLMRTYARSPNRKPFALRLYHRMLIAAPPSLPDNFTFPAVLKACAFLSAFSEGSQVHAHLLKLGFATDVYVVNSLIHFYSSCGCVFIARQLFDRMPLRSRVSWNVVIDGYVGNGDYDTALCLFREMQREFPPDEYTVQSAIGACAGVTALSLGMWTHALVLRKLDDRIANDVLINNSLIDFYSRCGSLAMARQVFDRMPARDLASWNAMIFAFAMHGHVRECFSVFDQLVMEDKLRPNSITFVGVLSACNHRGLVDEGRKYFSRMASEFKLEPQIEHFGCIVDLLARAGHINDALDIVFGMPCKPDAVIWRSLLDACCKQNAEVQLSESVARHALELDNVTSSGVYVLLSRVYAFANRWNDVGSVRKLMAVEGIHKEPGCSSIEMDGVVHQFVAGDTSHPRSKEIYEKLKEVEDRIALVGYKPDSTQAPLVAGFNSAKEDCLRLHSERLAIAFGLLNKKSGTPIRIMKNLRICRDCHTITKLISKVYLVEIIVRDRIRFHQFKDGLCSCSDYW